VRLPAVNFLLTFTLNDISTSSSKLHTNVHLVVTFKNCSNNLIPCRTLVAMATERKNFKKKPKTARA
jgi:hypothetical protein